MRLFGVFILASTMLSCLAWAQEDKVTTATSALQSVLSDLKDSEDRLSSANDQLTAKDSSIKEHIAQLQAELERLQAQGETLKKAMVPLQDKNARRQEQIARLEGENNDLDERAKSTQSVIKSIQQSLDAGYEQDQKLLLQLKAMSNAPTPKPAAPSTPSPAEEHRQKEKLKLIKMIYDSQERQEVQHQSIAELQKNVSLVPAAAALAHQQLLKAQIKDLETEIAAYPPQSYFSQDNSANQWDDAQLHQVELELKDLEKNYVQLKDLMSQMDKKAQASKITVDQKVEADKLQGNIDDLDRQGQGLRAQLDDLRSQMVDLDKRKTYLDAMIKQLPQ